MDWEWNRITQELGNVGSQEEKTITRTNPIARCVPERSMVKVVPLTAPSKRNECCDFSCTLQMNISPLSAIKQSADVAATQRGQEQKGSKCKVSENGRKSRKQYSTRERNSGPSENWNTKTGRRERWRHIKELEDSLTCERPNFVVAFREELDWDNGRGRSEVVQQLHILDKIKYITHTHTHVAHVLGKKQRHTDEVKM